MATPKEKKKRNPRKRSGQQDKDDMQDHDAPEDYDDAAQDATEDETEQMKKHYGGFRVPVDSGRPDRKRGRKKKSQDDDYNDSPDDDYYDDDYDEDDYDDYEDEEEYDQDYSSRPDKRRGGSRYKPGKKRPKRKSGEKYDRDGDEDEGTYEGGGRGRRRREDGYEPEPSYEHDKDEYEKSDYDEADEPYQREREHNADEPLDRGRGGGKPPRRPRYPKGPRGEEKPDRYGQGKRRRGGDPQEKIDAINRKIEELTVRIGRLNKDNQLCIQNRDKLKSAYDEIKPIIERYKTDHATLENRWKERKIYSDDQTASIEKLVDGLEDEIHEIIENTDEDLQELRHRVRILRRKWQRANREFEEAEAQYTKKLKAFNEIKSRRSIIDGNLTEMVDLKNSIEQDEEERFFAVMYFKIHKYNGILANTDDLLVRPGHFRDILVSAWFELAHAMIELAEATVNKESAAAKYENKERELGEATASQDSRIVEALKEVQK